MIDSSTQNGNQLPADLTLVHSKAGFLLTADRFFLRITGEDAPRWLNGMVTNAAQALAPGTGNYNYLLNAQGRIQGDCLLFRETSSAPTPAFLLITDRSQAEALQRHLDKYIIMDDVELTPAFTEEASLVLLGAEAPAVLRSLGVPCLEPLQLAHVETPVGGLLMVTPASAALPQFEFRAPGATMSALRQELLRAGVLEVSEDTLERIRILEAIPRFGVDIRDRELPQETGQTHALHFAKGCYLGQEIVERIRSRGQVHRQLTALRLEGELPSLPTSLEANGSTVGELTSAAEIELDGRVEKLALGYVRREMLESRAPLLYAGGVASPRRPGQMA